MHRLLVTILTFLEKIVINENPSVAPRALSNPINSNDTSVNVAMITPPMMGSNDKYT